ncbi:MAG TPA: alpha/beta hydrolase, partial [Candidatus Solibacter sp.]|nr:alpha/beta hydrolase [Candidatus Solibacter sp.]
MTREQAATVWTEPTSRFVEVDGLKLHYLDWGGDPEKRTFLLLHGGAAHVHWWDSVAPLLTPYGRAIAMDFRGHGRSEWARPPHYGPQAYTIDVRGMIEFLGTRVVLVGHSMGGAVAQWVATAHPELLEALIVVDSPHGPPPLFRRLMWRWRRKTQGGMRPELESAEAIKRKFRLQPPGTYLTRDQQEQLAMLGSERLPNGKWAFRLDPNTRAWRRVEGRVRRPKLKSLRMPALILRGEQSTLLSARHARRMHRKIKNSFYKEIPRAFHHVTLDNPA